MLKTIFGRYAKQKFKININSKILDVGCFTANNLFPFADIGCKCFGIDINSGIIKKTSQIFKKKGCEGEFKVGSNSSIPYSDETFDLLISVNTLHYESTKEGLNKALNEFFRVLKKGAKFYICTVAPKDEIRDNAKKLENNLYQIQDFDFRDGQIFHFYNNVKEIESDFNEHFVNIEVGRITEKLFERTLDFFIIIGEK